jgi:hypothetical protein
MQRSEWRVGWDHDTFLPEENSIANCRTPF